MDMDADTLRNMQQSTVDPHPAWRTKEQIEKEVEEAKKEQCVGGVLCLELLLRNGSLLPSNRPSGEREASASSKPSLAQQPSLHGVRGRDGAHSAAQRAAQEGLHLREEGSGWGVASGVSSCVTSRFSRCFTPSRLLTTRLLTTRLLTTRLTPRLAHSRAAGAEGDRS